MLADRAVINAGPLVAFSLAGRLDLLPALFAEFWIPEPVYHEVTLAGHGKPGSAVLAATRWAARVREAPVPDPLLIAELDLGEAAVITLARALQPCVAVIDEKRGRRIAHDIYGLRVKGTAGLMVAAHPQGLLPDLRQTLRDLQASGYFIADRVIEHACLAAERH